VVPDQDRVPPEVTSPVRPWLGAVRLADDGYLDWECDYRAAFHGNPSHMADVIVPIPPRPPPHARGWARTVIARG